MLKRDVNTVTSRLPRWIRTDRSIADKSLAVRRTIGDNKLHTVCQSASCPNKTECWNSGTATFLILGNVCTRGCRFCGVPKGTPQELDHEEPARVAHAVSSLRLRHAVITSVTRDDLADGGAFLFAATIQAIRTTSPGCSIEVLVPDFNGSERALATVLDASPDVLNHNIETVPALYPRVRPQADYHRSLRLLSQGRGRSTVTKSGIMLGLGETLDDVRSVMHDLRKVDCSILTLGQYLRPGRRHLPVEKYYHPVEFASLQEEAMTMGFQHVAAGPLVRSSYHAEQYRTGKHPYRHR